MRSSRAIALPVALVVPLVWLAAALGGGVSLEACGGGNSPGFGDGGTTGRKHDSGVPIIGDDDDDDQGEAGILPVGDSGPLGDDDDDDDDDGGDAAPPGPSYGTVALAQTESSPSSFSYTFTVGFSTALDGGTSTCGDQILLPACVLTTCSGTSPAGAPLSAGVVRVVDGDSDGGPVASAVPSGARYPPPTPQPGQLFAPGDLLTVSASGSTSGLAAFSAEAIGPEEIDVTAPMLASSPSFPRSQPLTVTWANGFAGEDGLGGPADSTDVVVVLTTTSGVTTKTMTCTFAASDGQGEVPLSGPSGSYLDQAGVSGVSGQISLTPTSVTWAEAQGYAVTFRVTAGSHAATFTNSD